MGKDMRAAHCCLNNGKFPEEEHFNAFMENIIAALKDMSVSQCDIDEVVKKVQSVKMDILGLDDNKMGLEGEKSVDSSGVLEKKNPKAGRWFNKPIIPVKKCIVSLHKSHKDGVIVSRDDVTEHAGSSSFGSSRKDTLELISNRGDTVEGLVVKTLSAEGDSSEKLVTSSNIRSSLESNSFLKKLRYDDQCVSATGGYSCTSEEFGSLRRQQTGDEMVSSGSGVLDRQLSSTNSRGASSILNTRKSLRAEDES